MSAESVELVRRLNATFNAADWDGFAALLDPRVEFVDHLPLPDVDASAYGVEELRSVLEHWEEGFRGFHAEVLEYVDMEDYVVCSTRWTFVSRDNGIELRWTGAEAHQLRDGKVVWSAAGFADKQAALQAVELRTRREAALREQ